MNEKSLVAFSNIYINLIANSIRELLENGLTFSIAVSKNDITSKLLPSGFFDSAKDIIFDISEWSFEEACLTESSFKTMVALNGEDGSVGEFVLEVPFIAIKSLLVNDFGSIIVFRPFDIGYIESDKNQSEPEVVSVNNQKLIDFEQSNKDGIAHSMSRLSLCVQSQHKD